jgi:hypothetical protein
MRNKKDIVKSIAEKSGFIMDDYHQVASRKLNTFAELLINECADIVEEQARVYTGENNEGAGCHRASTVLRKFNEGHNV